MSKIESYVFEKDKIVIGGTLESLVYAYSQQLPVIYAVKKIPFQFDEVKHKNLKYFGLDPDVKHRKSEIWARTNFFLGLAGLLPMSDNVSSIRIKNSQLSVITKRYRNIKFNFNKLVVFDDEEIYGLPSIKKEIREKNRVFDWINVRSGCSHNLLRLQSDEQFVNEVIFYPTDRSNNRSLKDLVAISYLSDKQLHDFEYSDTMAKFKVTDMMKKAGIKGYLFKENDLFKFVKKFIS